MKPNEDAGLFKKVEEPAPSKTLAEGPNGAHRLQRRTAPLTSVSNVRSLKNGDSVSFQAYVSNIVDVPDRELLECDLSDDSGTVCGRLHSAHRIYSGKYCDFKDLQLTVGDGCYWVRELPESQIAPNDKLKFRR